MSNDEKAREIWHYSTNGFRARKNYDSFNRLLAEAIKLAPSNVTFTSPDIQKLKADFDSLKQDAMKLRAAMEFVSDPNERNTYMENVRHARQALADFDKKWGSK